MFEVGKYYSSFGTEKHLPYIIQVINKDICITGDTHVFIKVVYNPGYINPKWKYEFRSHYNNYYELSKEEVKLFLLKHAI